MRTAEEWANHFGLRPGFAELFRMVQHDAVKEAEKLSPYSGIQHLVKTLETPEPKLTKLALEGFWECKDCHGIDTRQDGEQGQPDNCSRCGSFRLKYHQPVLTPDHYDKENSNSI